MAWLVALDPSAHGKRFSLDTPCLIGRGPLNHIVIDDSRISRQHAKISPEDGGHVLYDLNSANGTFVNDKPVKRTRLRNNDVVHVGPFPFCFEEKADHEKAMEQGFGGRMEVQTLTGAVAPVSRIIEAVDAISVAAPVTIAGLADLEDSDRKLRTLYAFMQTVSSTLDVGELVVLLVKDLLEVFPRAEMATLHLRDEASGTLAPRLTLRRDGNTVASPPLQVQVISEVVQKGRAILSQPIIPMPRVDGRLTMTHRLTMHAPMIYRGNVEGVLEVHGMSPLGAPFAQRDLDLLNALAAVAVMALNSARRHEESLRQHRLQQDMLFARQVQMCFLPRHLPVADGIDLAVEYAPAYSVGGDFYDLFWLDDTRVGMFVGDIAGKGVSAALLMARMSSDLRAATLAEGRPGRALETLNRNLLGYGQPDLFLTCVCLSLDVKTGVVVLANAGHVPPLVRRARDHVAEPILGGAGTAIGFVDDEEFPEVQFELEHGDALVLCTDGVYEATSKGGEHFGFERIRTTLQHDVTARNCTAAAMAQALLAAVGRHVAGGPQYDDITLLVCARR